MKVKISLTNFRMFKDSLKQNIKIKENKILKINQLVLVKTLKRD